jgi:hypothetical protein
LKILITLIRALSNNMKNLEMTTLDKPRFWHYRLNVTTV